MNRPWETELEQAYPVYDERHAELRDSLLGQLTLRTPADQSPAVVSSVPRRVVLWRACLALAGCLLVAATVWSVLPGAPKRAFGMEDLAGRLMNVKSIYMQGVTYFHGRDKSAPPESARFERYLERPGRYLSRHFERTPEGWKQVRTIADGKRQMTIDDRDKTVMEGADLPLATEFRVENLIQNSVIQQLLGGATAAGFRKLRSEQLAGVQADVYEREFQYPHRPSRSRVVVWLDPATGGPMQMQHFIGFGDKPDELVTLYEKIELNVEPPAGAFDFTPPAGYKVEHRDVAADAIGSETSGGVGNPATGAQAYHALRFCFNINDRAALVCWVRYNDLGLPRERDLEGPIGRKLELAATSFVERTPFTNHFLRVDPAPKYHWRWSLVIPEPPVSKLPDEQLVFPVNEEDGIQARGTMFGTPLRFPRQRLAQWIVEAQRLTLPEGAPDEAIFTLEQLERLAEEFRRAE